jgi:hypothetical protein
MGVVIIKGHKMIVSKEHREDIPAIMNAIETLIFALKDEDGDLVIEVTVDEV